MSPLIDIIIHSTSTTQCVGGFRYAMRQPRTEFQLLPVLQASLTENLHFHQNE